MIRNDQKILIIELFQVLIYSVIYFSLTLNIACLNDPVIIFMFYTSNRFMMKPGTMFPVFSIDVGLSGAEITVQACH